MGMGGEKVEHTILAIKRYQVRGGIYRGNEEDA